MINLNLHISMLNPKLSVDDIANIVKSEDVMKFIDKNVS